jgi:hypothetical protein
MSEILDEIIRLTVAICRTGEPTTTDHMELVERRNQMVRQFKATIELQNRRLIEMEQYFDTGSGNPNPPECDPRA